MKYIINAVLFAIALGLAAPLAARDFETGMAAYERGDYAAAICEWNLLAAYGDIAAQYNLGIIYGNGHGVEIDDVAAAAWFRRAAEQGDETAIRGLRVVVGFMSSSEISEAHKLARDWRPK